MRECVTILKSNVPSRNVDFVPSWIDPVKLIEYWTVRVIDAWKGPPRDTWFGFYVADECRFAQSPVSFELPRCSLENEGKSVIFDDGRHRTRWMLQRQFSKIPIMVWGPDYYYGVKSGLISSRGYIGDPIEQIPRKIKYTR